MLLPLALALGALSTADVAGAAIAPPLDLGSLVDHADDDLGDVGFGSDDTLQTAARRPPSRRTPVRRPPPRKPAPRAAAPSPLNVGLAGAAGAAIGSTVGIIGIGVAGAFATQLAGPQPVEVVLATGALAIGIAVATPFMAGLGGGAGVLLADDRSQPEEWQGLLQCASSGYCAGLAAIAGPLLGGGVACSPQGCTNLPGPDRPAEWTAGASIVGLVAGGLVGIVAGYTLAPDRADPTIPIGIGAFGGAILGSAVSGGLAGGVAAMTRQ